MKTILALFIFVASTVLAESPQDFERIQEKNTLEIKAPSLHCRKTTKIRLSNGLEAYLISDPKATQSAAALAMEVGSWSDTAHYPGMAHFLEHLLFMGSETYPEESAYSRQVSDNGGILNAYTSPDRTVYVFSVNNDAFLKTLDIFSHMFVDPLIAPASVAREIDAVDQEHDRNIESDARRLWMVLSETGNALHPNALFTTGNRETLGAVSALDIKEWYRTNYSADKAHLVLYSPLPLEELERLTAHYFSTLPSSDAPRVECTQNLFSRAQEGHAIFIKPIKELRTLSILWELPREYLLDLDNKSHALLSYILEGKQKSSLYAQLKKEGLVENIHADLKKVSKNSGLFAIDFDLTPQGIVQFEEVIIRCFQTLNSLKKTGIPSYIFDEIITMDHINYAYQPRHTPFKFVGDSAYSMVDEPIETFPQKTLTSDQFNPKQISDFFTYLSPKKATYLVVASPELTNVPLEKRERWSGVQYSVRKISPENLAAWNEAKPHINVTLPEPNSFIPKNLQLVTNVVQDHICASPTPILLSDCQQGKAYFWEDSQYHLPKIAWIFNIRTPLIDGSSVNTVLMDIYLLALRDKIANTLSQAEVASLFAHTGVCNLKFVLSITGYSEKAPLLLENIISTLKSLEITKEEFDLYVASLLTDYSNVTKATPASQIHGTLKNLITNIHPKQCEKIAAIGGIAYDDFLTFSETLFNNTYVEAMLGGNMRKKEAHLVWNMVSTKLMQRPYLAENHEKKQMLVLSPSEGPYKIHHTTESLGNAALLLVQEGAFSFPQKAAAAILDIALQKDFFTALRTKQQTAYVAQVSSMEEEMQLYKLFMVQSSSHQPDELIARFELFLEDYVKQFNATVPEARFMAIRDNFITTLSTPPADLSQMVHYLNTQAFTRNGDFQYQERLILALKALTYEDLKKNAAAFFSRKNTRRIALMLEGKQPEEKAFLYKWTSPETLKNEGTYISVPYTPYGRSLFN